MPNHPWIRRALLLSLLLAAIPWTAQEPRDEPQAPSPDLTLDGPVAQLGDVILRAPLREEVLVALLGAPERTRYRLSWPGQGLLAVPGDRGEIEELRVVLCDGAPEMARVGRFAGRVRIDGLELRCSQPTAQVVEALPEDFVQTEALDAFVYADRAGLAVTLALSSWDGVLTLSLGFGEPDEPPAAQPGVRTVDGR